MATALSLDETLHGRMSDLARSRGMSPDALAAEALASFVEREEQRLSFLEEAEASWRDYQETGLHLTGDELRAWLRSWGTADEAPLPPCHV